MHLSHLNLTLEHCGDIKVVKKSSMWEALKDTRFTASHHHRLELSVVFWKEKECKFNTCRVEGSVGVEVISQVWKGILILQIYNKKGNSENHYLSLGKLGHMCRVHLLRIMKDFLSWSLLITLRVKNL